MQKILFAFLITIVLTVIGVSAANYAERKERHQQARISLMEQVHTAQAQGFACTVDQESLSAVCDKASVLGE